MWKDGQTDMTMLAVAFRTSVKASKNVQPNLIASARKIPFVKRDALLHCTASFVFLSDLLQKFVTVVIFSDTLLIQFRVTS